MVIALFDTGLCRSAFSTICFRKLVFDLLLLSVFFFCCCWIKCFESRHQNSCIDICVTITQKNTNCYVILFSLYKNSKYQTIYKVLLWKTYFHRSFEFQKKYIRKVTTVKKEECKICYPKINHKSLSSISIVYDSFILKLCY